MLSIVNVSKKYGDFVALEDINLEFTKGVYGLLAPNGAGKTTLLKMITTLLFPTTGEIRWEGKNIDKLGAEYRGLIGYLPQDFGYYPNYTPREFLKYMLALEEIPLNDGMKRIDELLDMVGLTANKNDKIRKFSGGMKQRVGIAQALVCDPKILILDEPTAGLDPKERVRFRNIIQKISEDRIVILSTHIVSDIESIANFVVMIKDHKLLKCDTSQNICNEFRGKIYEIPANSQMANSSFLLSVHHREQGEMMRVYSETRLDHGIEVQPNLEDAFLSIYKDSDIKL